MKKKLAVILSCMMILLSSTTSVLAADTSDNSMMTPMIIPPEYEYVNSSTAYLRSQDWTHESDNPTAIVQSTSYTVSRTASASFSTTISDTINLMIETAGVSLEVSIGTSTTKTSSHTYNIPGHSKYLCIYGSQLANIAGYQNYYWNGVLQSHTYVTGKWTYNSYDDMTYLGSY